MPVLGSIPAYEVQDTIRLQARWLCIYIHTRTAGDDNEKNSGAIALRISDTQAVNLVLRASWSQIYWRSTINLQLGIQIGPGREHDAKSRKERAFMCVIHSGEKNERCPNVLTLDDIYDGWTQHIEGEARVAAWKLHKKPFWKHQKMERTWTRGIRSSNIGTGVSCTAAVHRDKREFVVDSSASMHRKSDLTPEEKETIR